MHVSPQPPEKTREFTTCQLLIEPGELRAQALVELSRDDGAERIGGEVAEGADRPVNVLQAALEVIRGANAEALLHAGIPGFPQVAHRELTGKQLFLQLVAQHDVERVGELVRVDPDQPALHPREMPVDVLDLPLRPARAEMPGDERLHVAYEWAAAAHHHFDEQRLALLERHPTVPPHRLVAPL